MTLHPVLGKTYITYNGTIVHIGAHAWRGDGMEYFRDFDFNSWVRDGRYVGNRQNHLDVSLLDPTDDHPMNLIKEVPKQHSALWLALERVVDRVKDFRTTESKLTWEEVLAKATTIETHLESFRELLKQIASDTDPLDHKFEYATDFSDWIVRTSPVMGYLKLRGEYTDSHRQLGFRLRTLGYISSSLEEITSLVGDYLTM